MEATVVVGFAVGLLVLCMLVKLMSLPLKLLWKFITNSVAGAIMLCAVNLFGAGIKITLLKALVAGIFGIPGVIVILIARNM